MMGFASFVVSCTCTCMYLQFYGSIRHYNPSLSSSWTLLLVIHHRSTETGKGKARLPDANPYKTDANASHGLGHMKVGCNTYPFSSSWQKHSLWDFFIGGSCGAPFHYKCGTSVAVGHMVFCGGLSGYATFVISNQWWWKGRSWLPGCFALWTTEP